MQYGAEYEAARALGLPEPPANHLSPNLEVDYDDATHTYYLGDTIYRSATTIISQFHEKFDKPAKATAYAEKYGRDADYWIAKWDSENEASLHRGTKLHDQQEQFLYNRGITTVAKSINYTHRVYERPSGYRTSTKDGLNRIYTLADGCYPELKLWRHDWGIAGRADKPTFETLNGVRYAHVEDYKTNKVLNTKGYINKVGDERMMYKPISHLGDCEMTHYTLQLSLYMYMLEYFGFTPGIIRIIHFPHPIEELGTPKPVPYELPYLRNEVIAMLLTLNDRGWLKSKR